MGDFDLKGLNLQILLPDNQLVKSQFTLHSSTSEPNVRNTLSQWFLVYLTMLSTALVMICHMGRWFVNYWKGHGRKQLRPTLRHYPNTFLQRLSKTMDNLHQTSWSLSQDSNQRPPERVPITQPW